MIMAGRGWPIRTAAARGVNIYWCEHTKLNPQIRTQTITNWRNDKYSLFLRHKEDILIDTKRETFLDMKLGVVLLSLVLLLDTVFAAEGISL